ncbi:unnamed protein product [Brassica napus]|uniref:(rape) hypothetical protein n=1 Tax=Brassica napus TaxID=3708 RepID=A0A816S0I0_BRANA|nr:unnamed protein product [Brassica napus]
MERKIIDFEQGWEKIQIGITALKRKSECLHVPVLLAQHTIDIYTIVYRMCTQKSPNDFSWPLYQKYCETMEEHMNSTVLPALSEKRGDEYMLLRELVERWSNHKTFERYEEDFESFMLKDTASYYSCKASSWIQEGSIDDYLLKFEECLKKEKERVTHYLHFSSEPNLVKVVEHEFFFVHENQLLEKTHSEKQISFGSIAKIFKQHVTEEGGEDNKATNDQVASAKEQRWGSEELSDEDIEKVVTFLAYISDEKYLFAEFYRKKLTLRLLLNRGVSDDHERSILTKLKQQHGGQFTYGENEIGLTVTLLTTGIWPSYKTFGINLPSEMVKCVEVFKEFYEKKTKGRKLTWIHSLGTCHVNGLFDQKPIELIVSTHQAVVLLLFNTRDKLSYNDIQTQLNVGHEDLVWLLHSLSCCKYKILTKEPATETVSRTDVFEFNSKFTARMCRIKIPLRHVDDRKKFIENVDKDRRYAIDAAIVKIMKGRKALGHQQLVSECVGQLSRMFKPDIKAIKIRIDDLITRDYLERDMENPNMFRYLA